MYAFIRGKVVEAGVDQVVVDVGGVGYEVCVPLSALGKMPSSGQEVHLYTAFVVRELSHTLYGFLERAEKELFYILIDISGIGPKTALSLIGHLTCAQFYEAIQMENHPLLSKVPGIGKKTAERLVVELRGKKQISFLENSPSLLSSGSKNINDALQTLLNLGLSHTAADTALKKALAELAPDADLSTLVAAALRNK